MVVKQSLEEEQEENDKDNDKEADDVDHNSNSESSIGVGDKKNELQSTHDKSNPPDNSKPAKPLIYPLELLSSFTELPEFQTDDKAWHSLK